MDKEEAREKAPAAHEGPRSRIRLKFARLAAAKGLSHLEQIKELRRRACASGLACWPQKQGSPAPRMAFGPAVSQGHESLCEYADLYLAEFVRDEAAAERLRALDDERFRLLSARRVPVFFPSIEAAVNAAEFLLEGGFPAGFSEAAVDAFLALKELKFERVKPSGERKVRDARAAVLAAHYDAAAGLLKLTQLLAPGMSVKPETVAELMCGGAPALRRVTRKELYWLDSAGRLEAF